MIDDKFELIIKANQAIGELLPLGLISWLKLNHKELLTKIQECDKMIDMQWDTLSYDQLKSILKEKYNKFVFVKSLWDRRV